MGINENRDQLRFVVTVDTEADDAWSNPEAVRVTNIQQLERFQDLCDKYDIVPTYLLAYECATRDEALSTLWSIADKRRCEIGHHLHVWTTPPFQKEGRNGVDLDWIHAYQFQLPDSLFFEKAETLRRAIEQSFGRSPTSHRAGRWGIDQRTVNWLSEAGFLVETSMRTGIRLRQFDPDINLTTLEGRPVSCIEYELNKTPYVWNNDSQSSDARSVLEVPATVDVRGGLAASFFQQYLRLKWPGELFFFKVYRKLAGLKMLSPDPAYAPGELPRIIERAVTREVTVINLMFHSSELALHCSPYTRNQQDLDSVWQHLEEAFRYVRDRGIVSVGISDIAFLESLHANRG